MCSENFWTLSSLIYCNEIEPNKNENIFVAFGINWFRFAEAKVMKSVIIRVIISENIYSDTK